MQWVPPRFQGTTKAAPDLAVPCSPRGAERAEAALRWVGVPGRAYRDGAGWLANAATSLAAFVSTPGFPRKPRSRNQSMKRNCQAP